VPAEREKGGNWKVLAFFRDDDGQGLVEYALIIAVIAIAVIVAMIFLRGRITNIFSNIGNNLT
jgi:pilus assembly protein Flp/PilA